LIGQRTDLGSKQRQVKLTGKEDISLHNEFSERDWRILLAGAKLVTYRKDEVVVMEGSQNNTLFKIKSGYCNVMIQREGKQIVVGDLRQGTMFGEMSVLLEKSGYAAASVIAASDKLEVWEIEAHFLHNILQGTIVLFFV